VEDASDTDSFDGDSYVEVPRDLREPSVHYAPSMRSAMPAVQREEYPNHSYEPSIHQFGMAPPAEDQYSDFSPVADNPRYPMGGYSGRDMAHDPVHLNPSIARTGSVDSHNNDHYVEDGRKHPAFARQPVRSISSSRAPSTPFSEPRVLSQPESFSSPVRQRDMVVDPYDEHDRPESFTSPVREREMAVDPYQNDHPEPLSSPVCQRDMVVDPYEQARSDSFSPAVRQRETVDPYEHDRPESFAPPIRQRETIDPYEHDRPESVAPSIRQREMVDPYEHDRPESVAPSIRQREMVDPYKHDRPESFAPPIRQRERADPYGYGHRQYEEPQRYAPDTYYIIPAGTNVIFQDEHGNEIKRVGDFSGRRSKRRHRETPLIVQDEYGREIYRTPGYGSSSYGKASSRVSYMDHYGSSQGSETFQSPPGFPNVVLIERDGRQIPLTNSGSTSSGGSHYSGPHGVSYSSGSGRY
jgi:hypothetical protein